MPHLDAMLGKTIKRKLPNIQTLFDDSLTFSSRSSSNKKMCTQYDNWAKVINQMALAFQQMHNLQTEYDLSKFMGKLTTF